MKIKTDDCRKWVDVCGGFILAMILNPYVQSVLRDAVYTGMLTMFSKIHMNSRFRCFGVLFMQLNIGFFFRVSETGCAHGNRPVNGLQVRGFLYGGKPSFTECR